MQHEDYRELVALDAVGALTPEEAGALAEHLAACDECRREASELREAAVAIAYACAPVAPPAHLRARVLEGARAADSVLPFKRPARDAAANGDGSPDTRTPARDSSPARAGAWRLLASRPPLAFGAIAAAIIIVVLAALSVALWGRNRELKAELARLSQGLNSARGELMLARDESARVAEIKEIVTAPDAPVALLAGTPDAPGARARLFVDRRTGRAVLSAQGLPPAPDGKAYQLWYIAGGKPQPGAVFKTDAAGRVVLSDRVPEAGRDATIFAVTLEPAGGVPSPTGGMYLKGAAS